MLSWLPENVSTYGGQIDSIIALIYYVTLAWFVVTLGGFLLFLLLYRRREGRRATYVTGERFQEVVWILILGVVVLGLDLWIDFRGAHVWAEVKGHMPPSELTVRLTGKQFNWEILYPGPDGQFETEDDRLFDNELHVPVGKPVRLVLASKDVIHSLFLPNLRLKQDILPGREIPAWFQATKPGRYEMPCAELCGFGHSGMTGWLYVHPVDEYTQWVREQWPGTEGGE
ncbi:MAG: cytochrome c oxidase subunit II [Candidatus Methylomirabilia bacterium]